MANENQINQASAELDSQVAEIINWHFSSETGCPFWLNWAAEQSWNPLEEVRTFEDLCEKFPNFQDEWLRDQPNEVWVPKAYEGRPFNIFETGGTTGIPRFPKPLATNTSHETIFG